ncbi:MAG: hypothetical protein AABW80_04500 [Nanoarchaeota archaeon]
MVGKGKKNNKVKEKLEERKEVPWYIWGIIGLIILGAVIGYFFKGIGTYTYEGLAFTKERYGDVVVSHYSYLFKDKISQELLRYNLYLRIDPRENNVPVEGEVLFSKSDIILSVDTTYLQQCSDSIIAISMLQDFIKNNGFNLKTGVGQLEQNDNRTDIPFVNCETHPNDLLIQLKEGSETKIVQTDGNGLCYEINVNDCEILPAVEKFVIRSIIDAKKTN